MRDACSSIISRHASGSPARSRSVSGSGAAGPAVSGAGEGGAGEGRAEAGVTGPLCDLGPAFGPGGLSRSGRDRIYRNVLPFILGSVAGLALGLVGGGGSILTVPLLIGILAVPPREATTMSLIIVGISAAWASIAHARRGNVLWSRVLIFGALGIIGTSAGGVLNQTVPPRVLLAGFVVLMVAAAVATWRRATSVPRKARTAGGLEVSPIHIVPASGGSGPASLADRARARMGAGSPLVEHGPVIAAAIGVGLLTGFFGVGGGFLIVPALVLVVRLPMAQAIGTSLPIIAINSGTALLGHLGSGTAIDPAVTALFTLGAIVGGVAGGTFSTRLPAATLGRSFALVVLLLAAYLSTQVI